MKIDIVRTLMCFIFGFVLSAVLSERTRFLYVLPPEVQYLDQAEREIERPKNSRVVKSYRALGYRGHEVRIIDLKGQR